MDFSRAQDRLLSFAVSAMMTSAVLATAPQPGVMTAAAGPQPAQIMTIIEDARSAGFAGMKDMPAPAAVAAPAASSAKASAVKEAPPITPTQVQKLRNLANSSHGYDGILGAPFAAALGLGNGDRDLTFRSYGAEDSDTKVFVQIFLLPDQSGYVIIHRDANKKLRAFRLDPNMTLISGITADSVSSKPAALPPSDATKLCRDDLMVWAGIADDLGIA